MNGIISNIQHFSVHDGPGIRTTVFLKGCPLHCLWCHNPESISPLPEVALHPERCIRCGSCTDACQHHAIHLEDDVPVTLRELCRQCGQCTDACVADARILIGRKMSTEEVLAEIRKDLVFYARSKGGATFSGGEPLLQDEFLCALLGSCAREGIDTAVDTSGHAPARILERAAEHAGLFLYDLKIMNDDLHQEFTGVSNRRILENLRLLTVWKKRVIVRVPVIPGINDFEDNFAAIAAFVDHLGGIEEVQLLPYHHLGQDKHRRIGGTSSMPAAAPPPPSTLDALAAVLRRTLPTVTIGG
jgi:pyruvate formate lyase activating enzyme